MLAISVLTLACKKSGSAGIDTTGQSPFFKASFGSQSFVATTGISGSYSSGNLEIDGQQGATESEIVVVKLFLTGFQPGQTGISSAGAASGTVLVDGATQYTSKICTIDIKSSSKSYITGSFTFTSTDSTKVVGTFSEPYTGATPQGAFSIHETAKRMGHIL